MDAPSTTLFATGISGFVGRELLARLAPRRVSDGKGERPKKILGLSRNVTTVPSSNVELVRGDLLDPSGWEARLSEADVVVHAAAATGKMRAAEYDRVNVDGTRNLIEAAVRAGVQHFRYISTIATQYPELDRYPYGRSKLAAEELVRASGLQWSIVRPTIVLGRSSGLWDSLRSLAGLPVMPVFGSGRVKVQPILVSDLCDVLADWILDETLAGGEFDLGGPEVVTFEELLRKIRAVTREGGGGGRAVHLPVKALMATLGALEGPLLPVLPMTAGQLYAFAYDSAAAPNPLLERHLGAMKGVDSMLAELVGGSVLDRECEVFARYLTDARAGDYLKRKYVEAHERGVLGPGSRFDRALVALARQGPFLARLADAHARIFSAGGLLRRKLVLVLALLECSASERVDAVSSRSVTGFFCRAAWLGASFAFLLVVSTLLLLPVRFVCLLLGPATKASA